MSKLLVTGSRLGGRLTGRPSLWSAPAALTEAELRTPGAPLRLVHRGQNVVCIGMHDAVQQLLMRNFDLWQPASIALGYGGEYDQPAAPTVPSFQSTRVAPVFADTYVRKPIFTAAIAQVTEDAQTTERRFHYVAFVRPYECLTDPEDADAPHIDEFGLLAANGTLLAHYVAPPLDGDPDGRTEKNAKSDLEWLIVDWELEWAGEEA